MGLGVEPRCLCKSGEEHYRSAIDGLLESLQLGEPRKAPCRHRCIAQNQVKAPPLQERLGLPQVPHRGNSERVVCQNVADYFTDRRIVVYDEDLPPSATAALQ